MAKQQQRRRRVLARERGLVRTQLPREQRRTRCLGCSSWTTADQLRFGYCRSKCWSGEGPVGAATPDS